MRVRTSEAGTNPSRSMLESSAADHFALQSATLEVDAHVVPSNVPVDCAVRVFSSRPAKGLDIAVPDEMMMSTLPRAQVIEVTTSKTGKHGHAKCHFTATDIFTGKKMEELVPSSHNLEVRTSRSRKPWIFRRLISRFNLAPQST